LCGAFRANVGFHRDELHQCNTSVSVLWRRIASSGVIGGGYGLIKWGGDLAVDDHLFFRRQLEGSR